MRHKKFKLDILFFWIIMKEKSNTDKDNTLTRRVECRDISERDARGVNRPGGESVLLPKHLKTTSE